MKLLICKDQALEKNYIYCLRRSCSQQARGVTRCLSQTGNLAEK